MKVILRHKKAHPWSGINKYRNCQDYIGTYYTRSGVRYTGLTDKDAVRLGNELKQDLSPNSPYWDTFAIRIGSEELILDTSSTLGELQYLFLRSHKRVQEGVNNPKATANYLLINTEDEAKQYNKVHQLRRTALKELDKLSVNDMRKCLRIMGQKSDDTSNELVEFKLSELVENDPQKFLNLWVNNKDKETQFLIETAISKNIIRRTKNMYKYGSDVIANTLEEAIRFLDDKKNQEIKRAILVAIQGKETID